MRGASVKRSDDAGPAAYLNYSFGPLTAFCYSFSAITAIHPGSNAIIAIVFGEYVCRILYHTAFSASSEQSAQAIPQAIIKLVAVLALLTVCAIHSINPKVFLRSQAVLTSAKARSSTAAVLIEQLLSLLAVAVMGIVQAARGQASPALRGNTFVGSSTSPGAYALALYSGLWAFSGWVRRHTRPHLTLQDAVNYAAGQMTNTSRDLPRVIHVSVRPCVMTQLTAQMGLVMSLARAASSPR